MFAMILKWLGGAILGKGMDVLNEWLEHRNKIDTIRQESVVKIEEAKAAAEIKRLTADIDWEAEMAKQAGASWKDEYWTVILSLPMVLIFIPWFQPYVRAGFDALQEVPQWYLIGVGTAIGAAFGTTQIMKAITHWRDGAPGQGASQ